MGLTKITAVMLIVLAAVGISACNDDKDNDVVTSCTVTSCYTMMTDKNVGGVAVPSADISFVIEQNWTTATADIKISGLRLPDGSSYPSFTLVDCPWTVDSDSWMIFSAQAPTIESDGTSSVAPVLDNFKFEMLSRTVGQVFAPGVSFSFGVNSAYLVQGAYSPFFLIGETISTPDGGKSFTSYSPAYSIAIDNASLTATINIIGAQFADGMPSLNMEFSGIKATFCDDGSYLLSCDDLIPTISDTPYPNYPISDLRGTLDPVDGMELTFVCTVNGTPFSVSIDVTYLHQKAMEALDAQ